MTNYEMFAELAKKLPHLPVEGCTTKLDSELEELKIAFVKAQARQLVKAMEEGDWTLFETLSKVKVEDYIPTLQIQVNSDPIRAFYDSDIWRTVYIDDRGTQYLNKIQIIKTVRNITGCALCEAKKITDIRLAAGDI